MRSCLLAGNYINEEVKHVRFGQSGGNVGSLEGTTFVVLGVNPGTHGQLSNENITALSKQDGCLCGYHLDLRVRLHHLLDTGQW